MELVDVILSIGYFLHTHITVRLVLLLAGDFVPVCAYFSVGECRSK